MILRSLKEYYDRKTADPESGIAPEGWEWKEIPFVIVLNENGSFLQLEDMREGEGNKKRGKRFLVPQGSKKSSGIVSNLLWETPDYIFDVEDRRGEAKRKAFLERIKNELPDTDKKAALIQLLEELVLSEQAQASPHWQDIVETKAIISFRFDGDNELYCETQEVKNAVAAKIRGKNNDGLCLITGEEDRVAVLHRAIKGVWGAQSTGANIVSFQRDKGYDSYNKEQGRNAPIGETAMFAYTTAVNGLLDRNSSQRLQIGDASTIFWSDKKTKFEEDFSFFFEEPSKDDPDAGTKRIKSLFDSPKSGGYIEDIGDERFFVLGLSPNGGRISIRFWKTGTVSEFAENIRRHFNDLKIIKHEKEPEYYSIWRLLVNASVQDKSENIPPNIAGDFMRSILDDAPYPYTLLQLVLRRIKSDTGNVKPARAALIKAYLNRHIRKYSNTNERELSMKLDKEQRSTGYLFGRLFATLEKIQEEANPGLNATIRERYYGAACSAPVTVFPTLLRLKNHHLAKLENKGRVTSFERLIGEIVESVYDFPTHLSLHEQGKFAIGYYHQRQNFFAKRDEQENAKE